MCLLMKFTVEYLLRKFPTEYKIMKIIKCLGGLGNQMFQYAFFLALKQKYKNVKIDVTEFRKYKLHNGLEIERIFKLPIRKSTSIENSWLYGHNTDFLSKILSKFWKSRSTIYEQKHATDFDKSIFFNNSNLYYDGYWQNPKYFIGISDLIRKIFIFSDDLDGKNLTTLESIRKTNSVGLHVRRGDYVGHDLLGGICDLDYYLAAIDLIKKSNKNPVFYIFSNDIEWCSKNLILDSVNYIDWNNGDLSYIDMQLMSECKTLVIANSSFSWWAAFLNKNIDKYIIAPKRWFNYPHDINEIIPIEWTRV